MPHVLTDALGGQRALVSTGGRVQVAVSSYLMWVLENELQVLLTTDPVFQHHIYVYMGAHIRHGVHVLVRTAERSRFSLSLSSM